MPFSKCLIVKKSKGIKCAGYLQKKLIEKPSQKYNVSKPSWKLKINLHILFKNRGISLC